MQRRLDSALVAAQVQRDRGIVDIRLLVDGLRDLHGVRHAGNAAGIDEGDALHIVQSGFGQGFAETDLVDRGDGSGFNLKAFARTFFVNVHPCWQIGHWMLLGCCPR